MKRRKLKTQSRAADILLELNRELDLIGTFGLQAPKVLKYGYDGVLKFRDIKERKLRRQEMRRLEERELLKVTKEAEKYFVALTESGAVETFRLEVLNADLLEDGRTCQVIFDIPESQKALRNTLRDFLKLAGFIMMQRSVWISPFAAGEALAQLFKATGASQWVRVQYVEHVL